MTVPGDGSDTGISAEQVEEQESAWKGIVSKGLPPVDFGLFEKHPDTSGDDDGWGAAEGPDREDAADFSTLREEAEEPKPLDGSAPSVRPDAAALAAEYGLSAAKREALRAFIEEKEGAK